MEIKKEKREYISLNQKAVLALSKTVFLLSQKLFKRLAIFIFFILLFSFGSAFNVQGLTISEVEEIPSDKVLAGDDITFKVHWQSDYTIWTAATNNALWKGRYGHISEVLQGKMWIMGGGTWYSIGGDYVNDVWYSEDGKDWTRATSNAQWLRRAFYSSVVFDAGRGNEMWILGGYGQSGFLSYSYLNDVWYSGNGQSWTRSTSNAQWRRRRYHSAIVYDAGSGSRMWVLGGSDGSTRLNDVWSSSDGLTWTQATANAQWSARNYPRLLVFDDKAGLGPKMWMVGGNDGSLRNDVWWTTNGATWTRATANAQWAGRDGHGVIVYDQRMWVLGGNVVGSGWTGKSDLWYSYDGISWTRAANSSAWPERYLHTVLVFDNPVNPLEQAMWVMAGETPTAYGNDAWYSSGTKIHICKTDAMSIPQECTGGFWCDTEEWSSSSPSTCSYTTTSADIGTQDYYAFVCTETDFCSSSWPGTFQVLKQPPEITSINDSPDPVTVGENITFQAKWQDPNYATGEAWLGIIADAGWGKRERHTSLVYNNQMWLIGGYYDGADYYFNDVWYSSDGANWAKATENAQWINRRSHTSVVYNNKMWVIGGWYDDMITPLYFNDVWYSSDGAVWTQATANAQWRRRSASKSLVYNNQIWLIGGNDPAYESNNDVWYSEDGVNWTKTTENAQWTGRHYHTVLVYNNKMWMIGGPYYDGSWHYLNDAWYSEEGVNWTKATENAQWPGRQYPTTFVYNNQMWIMGGWDGTYFNDVWSSADGVSWTKAIENAQWPGRERHTSVIYNNQIWVIGGNNSSGSLSDVWRSSPDRAKTSICKEGVDNKGLCIGGSWCESEFSYLSPNTCSYTASSVDIGTKSYYPVICNEAGDCRPSWQETFTVNPLNQPPVINSASANPSTVIVGSDVTFEVDWEDPIYASGEDWAEATANAQWSAKYGHGSVVYNESGTDKMWVMGGGEFTQENNDVWWSTDGTTWTKATNSAQWWNRKGLSSVVFSDGTNKMWMMGGSSGLDNLNDVWYSTDGATWTKATNNAQWPGRAWFGATVFYERTNKIWIMGGYDESLLTYYNDVWFSADGITWTKATNNAQWLNRRSWNALVFNDGTNKMWVLGGGPGPSNPTNDVWWSENGVTWTKAVNNAPWPARYSPVSAVYNNKIWVLGGWDGSAELNDVWYSSDGTNWIKATDYAQWRARDGQTSLVYNNKIWTIGGWDEHVVVGPINDVWYSTNDRTKTHICKESTITGQTCDWPGPWCDTTDWSSTGTSTCIYTATSADLGEQTGYAFVCDDEDICSTGTSVTFTVESGITGPTAAMICDSSQCSGGECNGTWIAYQPTANPTSCTYKFHNISTLCVGDGCTITKSIWTLKQSEIPVHTQTCQAPNALCVYTLQPATITPGNYTIKLYIEDEQGRWDETPEYDLLVKREIRADFVCSLNGQDWFSCNDSNFSNEVKWGSILYVKGDEPGDHNSEPSEGANIASWAWKINGIPFGEESSSTASTTLYNIANTVRLTIADDANRSDLQEYNLNAPFKLPKFKEIGPLSMIGRMLANAASRFLANISNFIINFLNR